MQPAPAEKEAPVKQHAAAESSLDTSLATAVCVGGVVTLHPCLQSFLLLSSSGPTLRFLPLC